MKGFIAAIALVALTACATTGSVFGPTPEAQIKMGGDSLRATAVLATVALSHNKISVPHAKSYSAIMHTTQGHLDATNATLVACRTKTGSKPETRPDPCAATVADDIELALKMAADVKKTLDAKQ